MHSLSSLIIVLIVTTIAGHFSARLNLPPVIGQLLSGIIIGPALLNWVQPGNFIANFSEIGVIILMFLAGLETDLELLKKYLTPSLLVAVSGIILPLISSYLIGVAFGLGHLENLFLGVFFTATSVSISVEVLKNTDSVATPEGTTILGAAVIDDILSIIVLSLLISFAGNKIKAVATPLWLSLLEQLIFLIALFAFSYWLLPRLLELSKKLLVPEAETITALVLCLGAAYLADKVGLSTAIGAFFIGLAISPTKYKAEINHQASTIGYAVFIPVFFVSVGLNLSFAGLARDFGLFLALTLAGIISKWLGAGLGAKMAGFSWPSASMIGAGMISRGEMALIIAQMGFEAHLLSTANYSAVIGAIVVITLCAPFILNWQIKTKKN